MSTNNWIVNVAILLVGAWLAFKYRGTLETVFAEKWAKRIVIGVSLAILLFLFWNSFQSAIKEDQQIARERIAALPPVARDGASLQTIAYVCDALEGCETPRTAIGRLVNYDEVRFDFVTEWTDKNGRPTRRTWTRNRTQNVGEWIEETHLMSGWYKVATGKWAVNPRRSGPNGVYDFSGRTWGDEAPGGYLIEILITD